MRLQRLRFEFRMELAAQKVRMVGKFHDLYISPIGSCAGKLQPRPGQDSLILPVELIAVAMPFTDLGGAVCFGGQTVESELARPRTQTHGAAQFVDAAQLPQLVNDAMGSAGIELAGIRVFKPTDVAGEFYAGRLHAEADAKIGDFVFAGITNSVQHAFNAAFAETAGNQDAIKTR